MTSYSRQDVLRILQISTHQLLGWERAGLIEQKPAYTFQDLSHLKTFRALRKECVSAASIRHSILAMKAVAGMANPLLEATLVRTGTRLAFRHGGLVVDPVRRQFLFDFERMNGHGHPTAASDPAPMPRAGTRNQPKVQDRFFEAVQAEETGEKMRAVRLYQEILEVDPTYAAAYINLGTINFHLRQYAKAEELYRRATEADPGYVLAFFDLGNVLDELHRLDESIVAYLQAVSLSPRYADAHYNLALAYERKGESRPALRHWEAYIRLDRSGPWADHARTQIRKLIDGEQLSVAWRADKFVPPSKSVTALQLASPAS